MKNSASTSPEGTLEIRNPADLNEVVGVYSLASRSEVEQAIQTARQEQPEWARSTPARRAEILHAAAQKIQARGEEFARLLTREEGKTLAESRGEVTRARDIFHFFAGEAVRQGGEVIPNAQNGQMIFSRREPLGVVAVITPWNFPVAIPAWKIAPALAFGNAVVFKPATNTPGVARFLVDLLHEAGLPAGVLNLVIGSGKVAGNTLTSHPDIAAISFTGSYDVGNAINATATQSMKRIQCEMGGKNPLIVLKDADLDLAVRLTVKGGFGLTGQACTATSRVIVEHEVADRFITALVKAAESVVVGNGLDPRTEMGPVVSHSQLQTDLEYVRIAQAEGARLLTGGQVRQDGGLFFSPTVFDQVQPDMRIAQEEVFGPVISVLRVADVEEAIRVANNSSYGLTAGVVTNSLDKAFILIERLEAGLVKVNEPTTGLVYQAPFGGFKKSSTNTFKEQGRSAVEFYTRTKTVYLTYKPS